MNLNRRISHLAALALVWGLFSGLSVPARAAQTAATKVANVVVAVNFSDTEHGTHTTSNACLATNPAFMVETLSGSSPRSMENYLSTISYGQLQVTNLYPQYNQAANTIKIYQLQYDQSHYVNMGLTGIGTAIISEILPRLQEDLKDTTQNLDMEPDGTIDNLTLVLPADSSEKAPMDSHQSHYSGNETVNGLLIRNYMVISEANFRGSGASVPIHEFLHSRGYPDLYDNTYSGTPVGRWCIMSSASYFVQYPLAYLRSSISKWFTIPTVLTSQQNYSLYAPTATDESTKDRQAVILKTNYSDSEIFVLEYRKQGNQDDLEHFIHGSGLIIYRVNLADQSNFSGKYGTYVFRPGDKYENGREQGFGNLDQSFLSDTRPTYGTTDPGKSLADGAITYSDGHNSGIVISNVGPAGGDTITFDITLPEQPEDGWTLEDYTDVDATPCLASYVDGSGTMYQLLRKSGSVRLYQHTADGWQSCSDPLPSAWRDFHLFQFGGSFYATYADNNNYARLQRLNGSAWESVYTSPQVVSEFSAACDASGIYLAYRYSGPDSDSVFVTAYTSAGVKQLSAAASGIYAANPSIAVENGTVAVMYADTSASSGRLVVKTYAPSSNTWNPVGHTEIQSTNGKLGMYGGKLYLLKSSVYGSDDQRCFAYTYDLSAGGDWSQLGDAFADRSILAATLCFPDGTPTILYHCSTGGSGYQLRAVALEQDTWVSLGDTLTRSALSVQSLDYFDGNLYAAYVTIDGHQAYLKSYLFAADHTHTYQSTVTKAATCGAEGIITYTCTGCSRSYTEAIPKLTDHSYGEWTLSAAPTCTQAGSEKRTCSVCGGSETRTISATGHSWNSTATVDTPAAYSHPGSQSIHCKNCDATKDRVELPAKPNPFADVTAGPDSYYYTPVLWALDNGVTTGTTPTLFSPLEICSRGQVVTFLWRAAGSPAPSTAESPFTDISSGAYYYHAVLWAAENGITTGIEPTRFAPNDTVTRSQFVTFLWRLAGKPASSGHNPFTDISSDPKSYYYDAVLWAFEHGITTGATATTFAPGNTCLRAQTVTFLHRYYTKFPR